MESSSRVPFSLGVSGEFNRDIVLPCVVVVEVGVTMWGPWICGVLQVMIWFGWQKVGG